MYVSNAERNRELKHHGILGMKRGKKQGPPYPLNPADHSAAEKKAGYQKSIDKGSSEVSKSENIHQDYQKKLDDVYSDYESRLYDNADKKKSFVDDTLKKKIGMDYEQARTQLNKQRYEEQQKYGDKYWGKTHLKSDKLSKTIDDAWKKAEEKHSEKKIFDERDEAVLKETEKYLDNYFKKSGQRKIKDLYTDLSDLSLGTQTDIERILSKSKNFKLKIDKDYNTTIKRR